LPDIDFGSVAGTIQVGDRSAVANRMYIDRRLGGVPRYFTFEPDDWNMRIPHNILDSVCFIGVVFADGPNAGKFRSLGTGFFVVVKQEGWEFAYIVTAKHVLDEVTRSGCPHPTARLNKRSGKAFDLVALNPGDQWITWQSQAVDLAILPVAVDEREFRYQAIPLEMLLTNKLIEHHSIGLGDELFSVGLFALRTGKQRNIPIVRTGIIAALPETDEPFTKKGEPYHAYLVEMRSIGGLSGSPVFVFLDRYRTADANLPEGKDWIYFCLGLIRGHWDLKRETDDSAPDVALGFSKGENLNTGIAVVTPSQYIEAILNSPVFKEKRQTFINMQNEKNEPTEDSKSSKQTI
jgi:hypothetical protein